MSRKGTIELLEQGLNLKAEELSKSHAYFDSDYLLEQLKFSERLLRAISLQK